MPPLVNAPFCVIPSDVAARIAAAKGAVEATGDESGVFGALGKAATQRPDAMELAFEPMDGGDLSDADALSIGGDPLPATIWS